MGIGKVSLEMGLVPKRCFVNGMSLTVGLPGCFNSTNVENKSCLRVCEPIEDTWGHKRSGERAGIWAAAPCLQLLACCHRASQV